MKNSLWRISYHKAHKSICVVKFALHFVEELTEIRKHEVLDISLSFMLSHSWNHDLFFLFRTSWFYFIFSFILHIYLIAYKVAI